MDKNTEVIIVGAGAAGLIAAWEIAQTGRQVTVLEARDRLGGRIFTCTDHKFSKPVELGAEFIHGDLELTKMLVKNAGGALTTVDGSIWHQENGTLSEQGGFIEDESVLEKKFSEISMDMPVARFFENYLQEPGLEELRTSLKQYVQGYDAADIEKASTLSLKEDLSGEQEDQYRINEGYEILIRFLETQCREKGVRFFLNTIVNEISWKENAVTAITNAGNFEAEKILITVPVGVLQSGSIRFTPALPHRMEAVQKLGFGSVIKIVLQFREAFWRDKNFTKGKDLSDLLFLFSREEIPTWWTQYPDESALLTGWIGGPPAGALCSLSDEALKEKALASLANIFTCPVSLLTEKLSGYKMHNWLKDPHSCGAYSYEVVNGATYKKVLLEPEASTIFFAGEGLINGPEIGTVNAALTSGRDQAFQLIASFKK